MSSRTFRAYVDESGNRGWGPKSGNVFVLSAVIVEDHDADAVRGALDEICTTLGKPAGTELHWSQNVTRHDQRKLVSRVMAMSPITVSSVVVAKEAIRQAKLTGWGTYLSDVDALYNYAVRRLLERISWYVDDRDGGATITFAALKRFRPEKLRTYLRHLEQSGRATEVRWRALRPVRFDQPKRVRLLQAGDLIAGAVYAAAQPDLYGAFEPAYLMELVPRIYVRGRGKVTSYGMNFIGPPGFDAATVFPWWRAFCAACERQ